MMIIIIITIIIIIIIIIITIIIIIMCNLKSTETHMGEMSNENFKNNGVNGTRPLGEGSSPGRCFLV